MRSEYGNFQVVLFSKNPEIPIKVIKFRSSENIVTNMNIEFINYMNRNIRHVLNQSVNICIDDFIRNKSYLIQMIEYISNGEYNLEFLGHGSKLDNIDYFGESLIMDHNNFTNKFISEINWELNNSLALQLDKPLEAIYYNTLVNKFGHSNHLLIITSGIILIGRHHVGD